MNEVLTEKNKEFYFDYFQINPKKFLGKRILLATMFTFLYIFFLTFTDNILLYLGVPIVALIGYKIPYLEIVNQKERSSIVVQYSFPTFLRYFISLLDTQGNVYRTLKATIPYVNNPLKAEIEKLIDKMEESNVNTRDAFMEFAEFIGTSEARMIMGMIYEFNEEGINKQDIKELENTVEQMQENKTNELIEYSVNRMDKHANPILVYSLAYIFVFTIMVYVAYLGQLDF